MTVSVFPSCSRRFRQMATNFSIWSFICHLATTIDFILPQFTPPSTEDILLATYLQSSQAMCAGTRTCLRTMRGSISSVSGSKKIFSSYHTWERWMWGQSCWTLIQKWSLTPQILHHLTFTIGATPSPKLAASAITRMRRFVMCKTVSSLGKAKWQVALRWARLSCWFGRLIKRLKTYTSERARKLDWARSWWQPIEHKFKI